MHTRLVQHRPAWTIEVRSLPPGTNGFSVVRIRRVVERTNAWNGRSRRNSKDYERKTASFEARIPWNALHLMLNRLAPARQFAPSQYRNTPAAPVVHAV